MNYASVLVCKKSGEFDQPLTYGLPEAIQPPLGQFVRVPFRGKTVQGIVTGFVSTLPEGLTAEAIKPIGELLPLRLPEAQVKLAHFLAEFYHTSLTKTLRLMVPKRIWEGKLPDVAAAPSVSAPTPLAPTLTLTPAQEAAWNEIQKSPKPVLLHGVTGSGKTELYLRAILEAVNAGKQALLLLPEIALTPQVFHYFEALFGHAITVIHSRLTDKQKAEAWERVRTGQARLVLGSRSAVFAPFAALGLIVMDEEHEWTYKQESAPYYETHRVVEKMSELHGARLILGSATPRLESYFKSQRGDYTLVTLSERIHQAEFPPITVVDLREEFKKKNFSIFSLRLQKKITERLERHEQIILFVNQRGIARAVVCRDCGYTEECPHCAISLKYHRPLGEPQMVCHYCGFVKAPPRVCPACQSPYIKYIGVGTERVEEEVRRLYPAARVIRADKDTTAGKEGFEPIYQAFLRREYDILIGTQMVAKGLDFEGVSLVGLILADIGLSVPDFRSHERLFQLITQVAGRCGRSAANTGEVILQTYQPDHFAITQAACYGYLAFAEQELKYRQKAGYPPYSRLIKFTVVGVDPEKLRKHIEAEEETLQDLFKVNDLPFRVSAAPALIPKMANRYYYHVLVQGQSPDLLFRHWRVPKGWRADIDPVHTT